MLRHLLNSPRTVAAPLLAFAAVLTLTGGSVKGCQPIAATSSSTVGDGPSPRRVAGIARRVDGDLVDIDDSVGSGTGIVLNSRGLVLTNAHVVCYADRRRIDVRDVGNDRLYPGARLIACDERHDVALLHLDWTMIYVHGWGKIVGVSGLHAAVLGGGVRVGQRVVAIGNAHGRDGTPSASGGTVTFLDQSTVTIGDGLPAESLAGLIETDARTEPGDSGGPLVTVAGQVVGMDTAIGGLFDESYAIPIRQAVAYATAAIR
jgi:S1-C subfamily serine protease